MRDIENIIEDGVAALERLLREAFDAGIAHGHQWAKDELRARVDSVFNETPPQPETHVLTAKGGLFSVSGVRAEATITRAAPGTVKPTIIRLIQEANPHGISTDDLIENTGFKPNSVRGTVSTLQAEGIISKIENKWHITGNLLLQGAETNKGAV